MMNKSLLLSTQESNKMKFDSSFNNHQQINTSLYCGYCRNLEKMCACHPRIYNI